MKFKFTIQPYQTEAVNAVVNVFAGQPYVDNKTYQRNIEIDKDLTNWQIADDELKSGYANAAVQLSSQQLLANIRKIQGQNNIKLSEALTDSLGACSIDVEMETGTGKTYVYIKTIFELNRQYGWSKFIVVVPSVAIREGVRKSFDTMQEHFMEHYGKKARPFVYNSKKLDEIDDFSQSADISVMIINMQAFNTSFNEEKNQEGRKGDAAARIIFSPQDDFQSRRPIDVIAANCPIVIMDEPQKMGGERTQKALQKFAPLFCLNYSATHKQRHNLVYVLDALDAYNKKLVKQIEVKGFDIKNLQGIDGYLYLAEIVLSTNKQPAVRMEFEVAHSAIKREKRIVQVGDDLFTLSKKMEQYRGYRISEIDTAQNLVSFTNGRVMRVGEVVGDISEVDLRRIQIRETIRAHFEKEKNLFNQGIKVLSLFFIDEVAKYRQYDENGQELDSEYAKIFEQEYQDILNEYLTLYNTPYEQYLRNIEVKRTHKGYFSIDKGRMVDSSTRRGSDESDDLTAYNLILQAKDVLLSLDNDVRFIFSHSALREGWDNPNIFQICALKHGGSSAIQKRQEVGRGLRLCVNQSGDRMDWAMLGEQVHDINQLTVIAADGYKDFVDDLQKGIVADLYERPTKADEAYFVGKTLLIAGDYVTITSKQGRDIYRYLIKNDYIDDDDKVTNEYRQDLAAGTLAKLPDSCIGIADGVHALVQGIFDEHSLDDYIVNGNIPKIKENPLNDNFNKKEFQILWNYINHKYSYTVDFDSEELIKKAIASIDDKMYVAKLQYTVTSGRQSEDWEAEKLKNESGFEQKSSQTYSLERTNGSQVCYDLLGKIAVGTRLTRKSVAKILAGIKPSKFACFQHNPEEFISKAIKLINEQKATIIVEHITYNQIDGVYDSNIFTAEKRADISKAYRAKKNVQDYVFTDGYAKDGQSVERKLAEDMDIANEVCVYAKLPKGFFIPTPVGNYSPDWAIAFYEGTVKHIYFVAETKGSLDTLNINAIERSKIDCAKKLFGKLSSSDIIYEHITSYQDLLNIMGKY